MLALPKFVSIFSFWSKFVRPALAAKPHEIPLGEFFENRIYKPDNRFPIRDIHFDIVFFDHLSNEREHIAQLIYACTR